MKIFLTENAEDNLWDIYKYHADYSHAYADEFQEKLTDFMFTNLAQFPSIGTLYNTSQNLYRLVYDGRYNIYYTEKNDALYIIYVLDGRMQLNLDIANPKKPPSSRE
ncbi:MAG: type II toxin-antitoxin system RelE/ParE family toxin [Robiginitomaculum sp.]|nr:type II toxin-antitoxin system RelE/ParE family toxin [Robiginitomaculum sp.]